MESKIDGIRNFLIFTLIRSRECVSQNNEIIANILIGCLMK